MKAIYAIEAAVLAFVGISAVIVSAPFVFVMLFGVNVLETCAKLIDEIKR